MAMGRADGLESDLIDFGSVAWRSLGEFAVAAALKAAPQEKRTLTANVRFNALLRSIIPSPFQRLIPRPGARFAIRLRLANSKPHTIYWKGCAFTQLVVCNRPFGTESITIRVLCGPFPDVSEPGSG